MTNKFIYLVREGHISFDKRVLAAFLTLKEANSYAKIEAKKLSYNKDKFACYRSNGGSNVLYVDRYTISRFGNLE